MSRVTALAALAALSWAFNAEAAPITKTYSVKATNFSAIPGGGIVPFDPVFLSITITFDPSGDVSETTSGVIVNALNVSADTIGFEYFTAFETLSIGGILYSVNSTVPGTNDFNLIMSSATSDTPYFESFQYSTLNSSDVYRTSTIEAWEAIPEPASLAALGMGLLGLASLRRRD
jgi:hypothetical protein